MNCRSCGAVLPEDALFCGECGRPVITPPPDAEAASPDPDAGPPPDPEDAVAPTTTIDPVDPVGPPPPPKRPGPDRFPWGIPRATATIEWAGPGERFVLQFSTGESVTVSGTGLIGRNPVPQPGEYVDQLVVITDAGKSVSKTHLEFGQEGGRFWVSDRFSTNGSVVRQPDLPPRRCEPGKRYFVARGTRVDIGDQFFVVS